MNKQQQLQREQARADAKNKQTPPPAEAAKQEKTDTVVGGEGNETVTGGDTVVGGGDTVTGGEGNDTLNENGSGDNTAPTPPEEVPAPTPVPDALNSYLLTRFPKATVIPSIVGQIRKQLDDYTKHMGKTQPVAADTAVEKQTMLYHAMMSAIAAPNGDHFMALEAILFYFNRFADDSFEQRMLFRHNNQLRMYAEQRETFSSLLTLFLVTHDPVTRQRGLRSVNIQKLVGTMPNDTYRANLLSFYQ